MSLVNINACGDNGAALRHWSYEPVVRPVEPNCNGGRMVMRKSIVCIGAFLLALSLCQSSRSQETTNKFDPSRDAEKDVQEAIGKARQTHQRILLDLGGEWCGWCHTLDRFFKEHNDLRSLRDQNYIWVKVNVSPENENKAVLSHYPEVNSYPHLFVLEEDGKLLHSQDTGPLELGASYDLKKLDAFLRKWAPEKK